MIPDRSSPTYRRNRHYRLAPHPAPDQEAVPSMPPAGSGRRAAIANPAESDRRQLAGQVQAQIIAPLRLLLAQAAAFEQTLSTQPSSHMAVSVLAGLARQVLQQAYDLEASLHPLVLETLGLEPALEALAAQYERLHSLRLVLSLERLPQRPPPAVELALFRLAQDVLDALCDQHALQVKISLGQDDQALRLEFTCIGESFLPEPLHAAALQRIQPLGGTLSIGRLSDGQAHLVVQLPMCEGAAFTPRESQVLDGLLQGWSNKEIADCLLISPRTVNYHLDHIFAKLGVRTRTEAAVIALQQGWASRPSPAASPNTDPG
jgi:DNA-binding NarL/FixJ family response regulator